MNEEIILAAGCFWSVQYKLSQLEGVLITKAVYAGGEIDNPTYEQVCSDITGHAEAVWVKFDNSKLKLSDLLKFFFEIHDATQYHRQGPDIGSQYRSAIFYFSDEQRLIAEKVKEEMQQTKFYRNARIVTEILPVSKFFEAEEYHQHYYKKRGF